MRAKKRNIIAYYPNWASASDIHNSMTPAMIPWDRVTIINHAFFTVGADFRFASTDRFTDFEKPFEHSGRQGKLNGIMGEYKHFKKHYPDVKIMISVGGWGAGENFHAMAASTENRAAFINNVIDFLREYPFIDGIDLDWEFPGFSREGCPGGPEDRENFTFLIKEIRQAYSTNRLNDKLLTIAIPSVPDKIALIDPDKFTGYLDFINIMTYDLHGEWDSITGHQSPLFGNPYDPSGAADAGTSDHVVKLLTQKYKVPAGKINLGTPYYSHGWKVDTGNKSSGLFTTAAGPAPGLLAPGQNPYFRMAELEKTPGYLKYMDQYSKVPWLYNPNEGFMYTYEDPASLAGRCDYIKENGLAGIIIWEISFDDPKGFPMTTEIYKSFYQADSKL